MEYLTSFLLGSIVLTLVIAGNQASLRKNVRAKWICYVLAAIIWGAGQFMLQATIVEMIISIVGIELFAWVIGGFIEDRRRTAGKTRTKKS